MFASSGNKNSVCPVQFQLFNYPQHFRKQQDFMLMALLHSLSKIDPEFSCSLISFHLAPNTQLR
ncbi:hypothetical protein CIT292_08718 [Citrobacter youngae ATCC 29220]|uniref:Uncharacterized protein n=1 Tax=Citrobacter youngae ATCC 29220 TaxID=500640 RepID=D4BDZ9_9ENTR|nr:hypothetical protein CIT292_08718 [Citrobacter youngae ATCC 29220]